MNRFFVKWGVRLFLVVALLQVSGTGWAMSTADYNASGMSYLRQGEYVKAIDEFSKAIEVDPSYIKAYNNRGGAYVALQEYQAALADFDRALALNPRYARGYNNRAYVYVKLGKYDEALTDVNQALAIGPEEATFYDTRGAAYALKKLYPEALQDFKQALQMDPTLADVYVHRAQVYMDIRCWSRALNDYNAYIKYARPDKNDPELALAMRRCNEITQMMPELQERDKEKLLAGFGAPVYAAQPVDAFADVLWGATAEQIDIVMQAQGFSLVSGVSHETKRVYQGVLFEETGVLEFELIDNSFFAGTGYMSEQWYQRLLESLTANYGQPEIYRTKTDTHYSWKGLQDSVWADNIVITMYSGFWLAPEPSITYHNLSLEERLKARQAKNSPNDN